MKRFDEREIMFARMSRTEGTPPFQDYYNSHPEHLDIDHRLRAQLPIGKPGDRFYDPLKSAVTDAAFHFLSDIKPLVEGPQATPSKTIASKEEFTVHVKAIAKLYGASLVGITPSDSSFYYTHRGRTDAVYGEAVDANKWPSTIVFAVPMNEDMIRMAPKAEESMAVTHGYVMAAIVGMILTYTIKALGYEARNHMDGNYLMVLPLAAKAAGLGDIGQHGLLITEQHGPRVRLGAVSTTLPLLYDTTVAPTIKPTCNACGKCARMCPSKAISLEFGTPIVQEKCFEKWLTFGTDCGICLSVCPGYTK